MPKLLYIAGSGRSGSTLLDLLLGNHPDISGLGEVHRLSENPEDRMCSCQNPVMECEYWRPRIELLCKWQDVSIDQWTKKLYTTRPKDKSLDRREKANLTEAIAVLGSARLLEMTGWVFKDAEEQWQAAKNSWKLYDVVGRSDYTQVVIDSTKNALRMKLLYMIRPRDCYIIHLVRDGRAVVASAKRRKGIPIKQGARKWRVANRNVELALKTVPSKQVYRLRYEDLCENTETELQKICQLIDLQYDSDMIELKQREYHEIPGNPMLFRKTETEIVKDERWKNELTTEEIDLFREVAQEYNVKYGYE